MAYPRDLRLLWSGSGLQLQYVPHLPISFSQRQRISPSDTLYALRLFFNQLQYRSANKHEQAAPFNYLIFDEGEYPFLVNKLDGQQFRSDISAIDKI